jgi:ribokinase
VCETALVSSKQPRVAVVGHVEWVRFARVPRVPHAGEVLHAHDPFEEPAGGGAVAAVQLARLAGESLLLTALGEDEHGARSVARLEELGVRVLAAKRAAPTRTAVTLVDNAGERTIVTFGSRLEPTIGDAEIPWDELAEMDAVYFTAGDVGALRAARAARVLVSSPRALDALAHGVRLDALVLSSEDAVERREAVRAREDARLVVCTEGARGGSYTERDGGTGRWEAVAAPVEASGEPDKDGSPGEPTKPGDLGDSYGCGDSFAAGLTYALGEDMAVADALALAARCGAVCLTGRGPYRRQLTRVELDRLRRTGC